MRNRLPLRNAKGETEIKIPQSDWQRILDALSKGAPR
jgi:hypothetical protein